MSDDRLRRIEDKVDKLAVGQAEHTKRLDALSAGQAEHSKRLDALSAGQVEHTRLLGAHTKRLDTLSAGQADQSRRLDGLMTGVDELRTDVRELRTDVGELRTDVGELRTDLGQVRTDAADFRTRMLALHEDVVYRLKILAEGNDGLRIEMNRRFDDVLQKLDDHAIPGDAADRYFGRKIKEHDRRITALERRRRTTRR